MTTKKTTRIKHPPEFKAEALQLANTIGVVKAAKQLSLYESQLYAWRKSASQKKNLSQQEQEQVVEIAKLKRQLAVQAEELDIVKKATFFAKNLK
jgi:transposase